jgi:hypothetical protein
VIGEYSPMQLFGRDQRVSSAAHWGGVERDGGRVRAHGLWDPGLLLTPARIQSPLTRGGVDGALLLSLTAFMRLLQS